MVNLGFKPSWFDSGGHAPPHTMCSAKLTIAIPWTIPASPHLCALAFMGLVPHPEKAWTLSKDVYIVLGGLQGGTYHGGLPRADKEDEMCRPLPSCLLFSIGQVHGGSSRDTFVAFCTMSCGPGRRAEIV